jgi:hypothetical protein
MIRVETTDQLLAAIRSGAEIELVGGHEYLVDPRNPYHTAIRLDGISGLSLYSDRTSDYPATIKLVPGHVQKSEPVVMFGMGRTDRASQIRFERLILDGNDTGITGESKQQSALVRAFCVNDLVFDRVTFQNIAADGIKISGHPERGRAIDISIRDCVARNTGRAAIVVQSLSEDVEIVGLQTRNQRKAAIDIEATMSGHPGPRNIRIINCDLEAQDEYGLQIGGDEIVEAFVTGTRVDGILLHNARATIVDSTMRRLLVRKRSRLMAQTSTLGDVELTHHQSQCPSAQFRDCDMVSLIAKSHAGLELSDCLVDRVVLCNEARGVDVPSAVLRKTQTHKGRPVEVRHDAREWSKLGGTRLWV